MGKKQKDKLADELMDDLIESPEAEFDFGNDGGEDLEIVMSEKAGGIEKKSAPPPKPPVPKAKESALDDDKTEPTAPVQAPTPTPESKKDNTQKIDITTGAESIYSEHKPSPMPSPLPGGDPNLVQSENLKIAQNKIHQLEREVETLRSENEELAAAAEMFKNKLDSFKARAEEASAKYSDIQDTSKEEKEILLNSLAEKENQTEELRQKIIELETRLKTSIQKVRVRERELENRLELVKFEGSALMRSKDEMILDLKRQLDQLNMELENSKTKSQEINKQLTHKQDVLRRTVKTLRLALSMLETDEPLGRKYKKVD